MDVASHAYKYRRALAVLWVILAISTLASCARAPDLVGIDNPQKPARTISGAMRQKIFIATTRQATEAVGAFYSGERAPELGLASVIVSIPPNHVPGNLERANKMPPDPETEFAVIEPTVYQSDSAFIRSLNAALVDLPHKDQEFLFFVHGYNNTVSDAILLLAQFVEDTDFRGVPVLFSWASSARVPEYVHDLNSAMVARTKFSEVTDILARTKAREAHVLAHSMGAFLTMEAILAAELEGGFDKPGRVTNIILASPDIDIDLFRAQLAKIENVDKQVFVFTSKDDAALSFSQKISGGIERVGSADAEELEGLGVTVVDLSEIDSTTSGSHSKFAGSPEVVQLIGLGLKDDIDLDAGSQDKLEDFITGVPILFVRN